MASFGFYFTHFYSIYAFANLFYWLYDFFCLLAYEKQTAKTHYTAGETA